MRILLPILVLLLASGCTETSTSDRVDVRPADTTGHVQPRYTVLAEPPGNLLDRMRSEYRHDFQDFHRGWTEKASGFPLDGQRAIQLLEVACYADVMCHRIEYPLRVATLDYIEENMHMSDVEESLRWIKSSYESGLPLDSPDDETGQFRGMLVEAMDIRMNDYADKLLHPQVLSQHRK